jgi:hypothetical protein
MLRSRVLDLARGSAYEGEIEALLEGRTDPYVAAERLLSEP